MTQFNNSSDVGREASYGGGAPTRIDSGTVRAAIFSGEPLIDRVRWAAVLAGIFVALSTLAVLSVFGAAVGLSVWSVLDRPQGISMGVGLWGMLSSLIAFFVGGCVAAWSAANHRRIDGIINGMMVWAVAIPLLAFGVLGAGAGAASGPDGSVAMRQGTMQIDPGESGVYGNIRDRGEFRQSVASTGAAAAWTALASLLLGLCAAAGGGYLGAREARDEVTPVM